ncbi:pro-sigmaK processing inhibitor BofA family protein [Cohnella ginsengisoli]|uniref:Pro-sigmaK processing inhibitor BofA family protein n=1 Tax=Cohnella ginsengisoli TaxID=425004 RepID=A0A9X4KR38_9BACL|nr:pro-sigmaK processing inhibitor BofA family protein [Cohnella ginsengisoli]MDG0794732.1 pro-sigmaK processing inhibitor BofA family protein [Cohnella ginsengisoli]
MKTVWLIMLVVSAASLLLLLLRRSAPGGWLLRFGTHLALAAFAIYALNFSGWISGWHVPLNPATIGAVTLLGLPGVALVLGLQHMLIS